MPLRPPLHVGTARYPEKIARRLRAVSIAAWSGATIAGIFGIIRLFDPLPGRGIVAALHLLAALAFLCVPMLYRFGPLVGPLAFLAVAYVYIFWVISVIGTAGGSYLYYLTAAALGVLFVGTERLFVAIGIVVSAVGLIILVHHVLPVDTGFATPRGLFYANFITNVVATSIILFVIVFYAVRQIGRAEDEAEREYRRSESLLVNILPSPVAERLKGGETVIADRYDDASILFADMAGFTARTSDTDPAELVRFLNGTFTLLDALVERHGLEKIKTSGDAYMVVSGVPEPRADHAEALALLALEMREALKDLTDPKGRAVPVRIGLASGPVVAGVVGTRKFFYDVWGDAVNLASRMESTGEPGKIQVTPELRTLLAGRFAFDERGLVEVKGKGEMRTWFLIGRAEA